EVARWPVVGAYARATDTVFLDRGGFRTSAAGEQIGQVFAANRSVVLFPQGTTSAQLPPQHFHARLFAPALATSQPVQPVALRYFDAATVSGQHQPLVPWQDASLLHNFVSLLRLRGLRVELTL